MILITRINLKNTALSKSIVLSLMMIKGLKPSECAFGGRSRFSVKEWNLKQQLRNPCLLFREGSMTREEVVIRE